MIFLLSLVFIIYYICLVDLIIILFEFLEKGE